MITIAGGILLAYFALIALIAILLVLGLVLGGIGTLLTVLFDALTYVPTLKSIWEKWPY